MSQQCNVYPRHHMTYYKAIGMWDKSHYQMEGIVLQNKPYLKKNIKPTKWQHFFSERGTR
jgi:hypothetical protein